MSVTRARAAGSGRESRGVSPHEIVASAATLFRCYGFRETSLNAIGERLGVTGAAIYYHFSSKEEILFAYLSGAMRELMALTEEALNAAETPQEKVRAFAETYVAFQLRPFEHAPTDLAPVYGVPQLIPALSKRHGKTMVALLNDYVDRVEQVLHAGIEQGVLRDVDPTATVFAILGMVEHAGLWFSRGHALRAADVTRLYGDYAVAMVTADT